MIRGKVGYPQPGPLPPQAPHAVRAERWAMDARHHGPFEALNWCALSGAPTPAPLREERRHLPHFATSATAACLR